MMTLARRPLLTALLAAPALANGQTRRALTIAVQDNPPQLDPLRLQTNVTFRIAANLFDTLLPPAAPAGIPGRPGLAESWRRTGPTTLEATLRDNVQFHDGDRLTAADVAFSYGPARTAQGTSGFGLARQFLGTISAVEALDARRVRITTAAPDPLLEHRLAGWGAQIMPQAAFGRAGGWDAWALAPVGTGPYRLAEMRAGDLVRLVAHDAYWGGAAPYSELRFRVMPEAAARVAALRAGDVDIATEIGPDQLDEVVRQPSLAVEGGAISNMRVVSFGTQAGGPLADARIRRALIHGVDRSAIAQSLFAGRVGTPPGFQWQAQQDFVGNFPGPRFDPDAARRELRAAGYAGQPIVYRTLANYYTAELATAQALAAMWQATGINVALRVVENWSQVFAQPNDAIFNGSINMIYPDVLGTLWPLYGPTGFIRTQARSWTNAEFDALGARLLTEADPSARLAAHRRILEIFGHDDPPGLPLHDSALFYGRRRDVRWTAGVSPAMDFGPFNPAVRGG